MKQLKKTIIKFKKLYTKFFLKLFPTSHTNEFSLSYDLLYYDVSVE